jgi:hypothetical protein
MEICLLLTSTIDVQNKSHVIRNDSDMRLNDYAVSLKKWLKNQQSIKKIVFVENSGHNLDYLMEVVKTNNIYDKQVEFLSFKYSAEGDTDISMGEIKSIEYAMSQSQLLKTSEYFLKVTGRVFVRNIDSMVKNLYSDFHIVARLSENLMYMDSMAAFFNTKCYLNEIQPYVLREMADGSSGKKDFESIFARAVHFALSNNYKWYPLPEEYVLEGISGTKNISYLKKYGRMHAFWANFVGNCFNKIYRNAYNKKNGREHFLSRWNVEPLK